MADELDDALGKSSDTINFTGQIEPVLWLKLEYQLTMKWGVVCYPFDAHNSLFQRQFLEERQRQNL